MPDDLLRVERRRLKRSLQAGDELAFSPVHFSGDRVLSHTIRYERGRYRVRSAEGTELGAFATFAGASRAGLEASASRPLEPHPLETVDLLGRADWRHIDTRGQHFDTPSAGGSERLPDVEDPGAHAGQQHGG